MSWEPRSRRSRWAALLLGGAVLSATLFSAAWASTSPALLVVRVMAYNRSLAQVDAQPVRLTVLHPPGPLAAESQCGSTVAALHHASSRYTVAGRRLEVVALEWRPGAAAELARLRPGAVYVCAGLSPAVAEIARVTRLNALLTFAADPSDVRRGLSISFVERDARRQPIVSLGHARAEGASLDAAFLSLAEILP